MPKASHDDGDTFQNVDTRIEDRTSSRDCLHVYQSRLAPKDVPYSQNIWPARTNLARKMTVKDLENDMHEIWDSYFHRGQAPSYQRARTLTYSWLEWFYLSMLKCGFRLPPSTSPFNISCPTIGIIGLHRVSTSFMTFT